MKDNIELNNKIKSARKNFFAIATAYFMGLFNDNFFKEAAVLIAVAGGKNNIQSIAMGIFTICYMLVIAQAGWLADKYSKGSVIIGAKALEFVAMIFGAFGIWYMNWYLILIMIGIMGAQSAIFSPSMNGSIPELYPAEYVPRANAIVKVISTAGIFIGMIAAGYILDLSGNFFYDIPKGRGLVGVLVLLAAGIGFFVSIWSPKKKAANTSEKFPWSGPIDSFIELYRLRKDRLLAIVVMTDVMIWFIATLMTMLIINLGTTQYRLSNTSTVMLKVVFMTGIAVGGFISNFIGKGERWWKLLVPTLYVVGLLLVMIVFVPYLGFNDYIQINFLYFLIGIIGVAGGIDLIPVESFIQIRPSADRKGTVIATANFAIFLVMTFGAGFLYFLNEHFIPTQSFGIIGVITIIFAYFLKRALKKV